MSKYVGILARLKNLGRPFLGTPARRVPKTVVFRHVSRPVEFLTLVVRRVGWWLRSPASVAVGEKGEQGEGGEGERGGFGDG